MLALKYCPKILRNFSTKISYKHHIGEEPLRHLTIGQLLQQTVSKFGDREAVIGREQNKILSFSQALIEADKLAAGLQSLGIEKNDRVGIWAPNYIEWYISFLACARAGAIMVALNPAYEPPELEYCINKVNIKTIICAERFKATNYYENLLKIAPELEKCEPGKLKSTKVPSLETIIMFGENQKNGTFIFEEVQCRATPEAVKNLEKFQNCINPDDATGIQFTSGTTGKPKAAIGSHFSAVNNGYYIGKQNELFRKHHKICVQVPLFHVYGTIVTIMAALNHGTTLVFPSITYNPDKTLDALVEEKCTMIHGTPTMYVDLVHKQEERNEPISPEIALSGGALCSPHLFKKILEILKVKKIKSLYGLTETTASVFQNLWSESLGKTLSSVGHVGEHLEVKVIDGNNNVVPCGTPGELCVRGYSIMLGYWQDEAKTKEILGPDGWLKTGCVGFDEDGYGKVVGRIKEMINRGGENIFPKEIEEFLMTHSDILETYVIGLPHERLGEEVCACIKLKPGSKLAANDVKAFCKGNISYFKNPTKIVFVDSFPKTVSGKIQKFKLRESVLNK